MNKIYPVILIALLALCAIQGNRLSDLQDSESFYRFMITTSTLTRIGDTLEPDSGLADISMDEEIFEQLESIAETLLIDYEVDPKFDMTDGENNSRLLRAVRQVDDEAIWALALSPELAELKKEYLTQKAAGNIQSAGSHFASSDIYGDSAAAKATANVEGVGLTTMFFGMRTLAANFLWLKVDTFWHAGEVHRMIPLMHTCVALDPQFVDAYLLGAWHLAYNVPAKMLDTPEVLKVYSEKYQKRLGDKELFFYSATEFLKDGIRKNPRDYRLYFDLGYGIYEQKLDDHENAIRYMDEAIRHKHDRWVPRMLYRSLMLNGQYEDAIEGWEGYAALFPENNNIPRLLKNNIGYLHDAISEEAKECKKLALSAQQKFLDQAEAARANDPAKAVSLEAEAQKAGAFAQEMEVLAIKEFTAGMKIWTDMQKEHPDDTRSIGRIARNRALILRDQGRYMEAIAELDIIRWQDLQFFNEASDLIIDIKAEAEIPYTLSEQMELLRRQDLVELNLGNEEDRTIYRIECIYRDMDTLS